MQGWPQMRRREEMKQRSELHTEELSDGELAEAGCLQTTREDTQ